MSKNRESSVLLVCDRCGATYQSIKAGLRRCACGGVLKPQEKTHLPPEKPA